MSRAIRWSALAVIAVVLGSGCAERRRYAIAHYAPLSSGLTAEQLARFQEHCGEFGMPEKTEDFGLTYYLDSNGYVLEYAGARKIALWAAEHVTTESIHKNFPGEYHRPGWRVEQRVPESAQAKDSDYPPWGDPWNRGHLAPNADFGSKARRNDTFVLSNAVPQYIWNNQGVWEFLEGLVRAWVRHATRGEAYILTGGFLYDPSDDPVVNPTGEGSDGIIWYTAMGAGEVMVPTHLFKIILAPKPGETGQWESIAFVLENREYDAPYRQALSENIRSINWIETRAGLNFLSAIPEGSPDEHTLEAAAAAGLWTGEAPADPE